MKLIEPKVELIKQENGLEGIYKQIERVGRTCYKSEDKITENSAKPFVDRMIASHHTAMLEHGTVYLMVHTIAPEDWDKKIGRHKLLTIDDCRDDLRTNPTYDKKGEENWWAKEAGHKASVMAVKYADNPYSKVKIVLTKHELNAEGVVILTPTGGMPNITKGSGKIISIFNTILITTNYRVLVENDWLDDLKYLCDPTEFHEMRYSIKLTTSIGVSREGNRHRSFSMAEQSTRYCNYSKDKFGGEITFCIPKWYDEHKYDSYKMNEFDKYLKQAEDLYMFYIDCGMQPQEAREILSLCTATEVVYTGFEEDWKHFFDLRYRETTGKAHPNMKQIATMAHDLILKELNLDL